MWISLDVTAEQRKAIDNIIADAAYSVKDLQKRSRMDDMLDILEYESLLMDRRTLVNDRIMQVLSVEQQDIFGSQLRRQQQSLSVLATVLFNSDLSEKQEIPVIQSLMLSQGQVWSIVSDKSLSWEVRRKKLNNMNIFKNLSHILTKQQLNNLHLWGDSLKHLQRDNE